MAIEYLSGGESATAARMNSLYNDLDAKLTKVLCGKTPLLGYQPNTGSVFDIDLLDLLGNQFWFIEGDTFWASQQGGVQYDDPAFPATIDRFMVAELIVEGPQSIIVDEDFDDYHFFRIHNLNRFEIDVFFESGGQSYTIDPCGIKAIRRTTTTTGYSDLLNYLWQAKSGDPRFYHMTGSKGVNNVCSPHILHEWINLLTTESKNTFGWRVDHTEEKQIDREDYGFGNPDDESTLLGDLIHHTGKLIAVEHTIDVLTTTEIDFDGWQSLSAKLAQIGITLVDAADGVTITPPAGRDFDLVAVSTNLLKTAGVAGGIIELPFTVLDFQMPAASHVESNTIDRLSAVAIYKNAAGDEYEYIGEYTQAELLYLNWPTWRPKTHTVEDITSRLPAWENITPHLSFNGFVWKAEFTVDVSRPNIDLADLDDNKLSVVDGALIYTEYFGLGAHGWPVKGAETRFSVPRLGWRYGQLTKTNAGYKGPYIAQDDTNDFRIVRPPKPGRSQIKYLTNIGNETSESNPQALEDVELPGHYHILDPAHVKEFLDNYKTDGWYIENRTRLLNSVPGKRKGDGIIHPDGDNHFLWYDLLSEHYNHLAHRINQLKRGYPWQVWHIWNDLTPNTAGLLDATGTDTTIRPKNQWSKVGVADADFSGIQALGLEIYTEDDFPTSWAAIKNTVHDAGIWNAAIQYEVVSGSAYATGSTWDILEERRYIKYNGLSKTANRGAVSDGYYDHNVFSSNDDYLWLSADVVQDWAENLGFEFHFRAVGEALKLGIYGCSDAEYRFSSGPNVEPSDQTFNILAGLQYATEALANAGAADRTGNKYNHYLEAVMNDQHVRFAPASQVGNTEWIRGGVADVQDLINLNRDLKINRVAFSPTFIDTEYFINHLYPNFFLLYFDLNAAEQVLQTDGQELINLYYKIYGDLESDDYAVKSSEHFWTRANQSGVSIADYERIAAQGEQGRFPTFNEQDLGISEIVELTSPCLISATAEGVTEGRKFDVSLLDDHHLALT